MAVTLHQYLKESTRQRHESAEQHPFQSELAQGRLPLPSYIAYLVQLAHLHAGFEAKLASAAKQDPYVQSVVRDEHFQLTYLQADLAALQAKDDQAAPVACLTTFLRSPVFERTPASMLGVLYVLLGSKHGGKFIAHKVKESYCLDKGGYSYFDPFADRFRPLWVDFTAALNALPESEQLRSEVLEGADQAFNVFIEIGDTIWQVEHAK